MPNFVCVTCGTQFAETDTPPAHCPICEDERQYVNHDGQQWTTLGEMQREHHNRIELQETNLMGIGTEPSFAIGQRALLVQTEEGNLLWDCVSLFDEATLRALNDLGGVQGIAVSHPHYYSSVLAYARAFDAPVYLHAADRAWVMRPGPELTFWEGEQKPLLGGLTLLRAGGHFAGGTLLHWPEGAGGGGALLTGDIIQVVPDRRFVSFMYSYPNLIPLAADKVKHIVDAVEPFEVRRIYGAWWDTVIKDDAKEAVRRSAERYIRAIEP